MFFFIKNQIVKNTSLLICLIFLLIASFFLENSRRSNCNIKLIKNTPKDSTVIVGHAYGNNQNIGILFDKDLEEFIQKNKSHIKTLIFTGDIFFKPDIQSWNLLSNKYSKFFNIYIAPGNHDIQNQFKEIFKSSKFYPESYPIIYTNKNIEFNIFIDNSIKNSWFMNEKTKSLILNSDKRPILLIHNPLFKEHYHDVNSYAFYKDELPSIKKYIPNNNFVVIAGDAGLKGNFFCLHKNNITSILSGVWDKKDDHVLIIHKDKIYRQNFR